MAQHDHTSPEPTEAELRAAWAKAWRPTWPDTFEAAMQDATLRRLVLLRHRHPGIDPVVRQRPPVVQPEVTPWRTGPAPVQQPHRTYVPVPHTPPSLDRMRRAAGERDDD